MTFCRLSHLYLATFMSMPDCVATMERKRIKALPHAVLLFFEPLVGFEPTTPRLQITCSGQLS